jgi:capsular exopolysaccharide synthesis family protein
VVAGAALLVSKQQTKKYTATASLVFSSNSLSQQIAGLPPSSTGNLLVQQASNLQLVKLGDMAAKTAHLLGEGLTAEQVASSLNIAGQGESSVVVVSATLASPALAAKIANTYVRQFVGEQQRVTRQYFNAALAVVERQLRALPARERFSQAGVALQNRAQTLRLLSELQYGSVRVAQEAAPPTAPSSPKTSRNALLGLVLGLLLGVGLAILLERRAPDRRLEELSDLEAVYRLPLLGVVRESRALSRLSRPGSVPGRLPAAEAEAFHLIRAHLRTYSGERAPRVVLLASAAPGDGSTTVARCLAEAGSRIGSRVLLLEADLRRPTLARQFDVEPGPGLAEVLRGVVPMDGATRSIPLQASLAGGEEGRTLQLLTAGASLPGNPGELLESHTMAEVLEQARSTYDLVVVDTPPMTSVSDAFALLGKVDGIVVVGRIGRSRRDLAERLQQVLERSGSALLGVVANGFKGQGEGQGAKTYVVDPATVAHASPSMPSSNGASRRDPPVPAGNA